MNLATNPFLNTELQKRNAAHHLQPFPANKSLGRKGACVIASAEGVFITDTDGNQFLDGMAGLWCVNIGYGRTELAEAASRQMKELSYYNTFF